MSTTLHNALVDAFRHHAQANLLSGPEAVESLLDYAFTMDELDTLLSYASADPSPSSRRCSRRLRPCPTPFFKGDPPMTRPDETIRAGDRVRYRDINLPDSGTVEHIEPPFARVRWSRWPAWLTREWLPNLTKEASS